MTRSKREPKWFERTQELIELYADTSNKGLAKRFGVSEDAIKNRANELGLIKANSIFH